MGHRLAIALVLVVVLAGCSGGGGPTPTPTPERTPTPTATPGAGTQGGSDAGPGLQAARVHADILRKAGSYTVERSINVTTPGDRGDYWVHVTAYVSLEGRTLYRRTEFGGARAGEVVASYKPPDERARYLRRGTGENATYRRLRFRKTEYANYTSLVSGTYGGQSAFPAFEDRGVVATRNGERHKYVFESVGEVPERMAAEYAQGGEVTDVDAELFVATDTGVVTRHVLELTVESDRGTTSYRFRTTYHHVGETTVPAPEWIDRARERTGK